LVFREEIEMIQKLLLALGMSMFTLLAHAAVDVNRASSAELETIHGIGPAMAKKILSERARGGAFKGEADLIERVPGLGPKKLERMKKSGLVVSVQAIAEPKRPKGPGADRPQAIEGSKPLK
jgi:competence protein ComEA